jgi:hypothetical protein
MTGQPPPEDPGFQARMEELSGFHELSPIPQPVDPLQAQTAFERRALWEDLVAHAIAVIQTSGFFMLAFAALLGYVDLSNSAAATFLGTVMGYAVGKVDPILSRYFMAGGNPRRPAAAPPETSPSSAPPSSAS